jgi:hypothetical protein
MDQQTWAKDRAGRTLAPPVRNRALVIDLEGALLRSGLLMQAVFDNPGRLFACLRGVMWRGIEAVEQVLDAADIDYAHLPYETDVLNLSLPELKGARSTSPPADFRTMQWRSRRTSVSMALSV